ncbi:MAG: NmrA family NAD(P)-binding protein [Calditrichaeota bacterium]|nr:NmrA family NAD(P)-binding protein [Candidatus Cloacimonadota bacterium]MCB1047926.1 NmrA family NAD(P)-binding protein [Calditrichota bacterium]MCB9474270.1 NmrA family NAD(P)-binding protein [Candidatus Delongbacteria bacterium]
MYVIMGASGHIGSRLAATLLEKGQAVRVVGRSRDRLQNLVSLGAEAAIGDQLDRDFLRTAFAGAKGVFVLIPPNFAVADFRAWQRQAADTLVEALKGSAVKRVVSLSSAGADRPSGTGPIVGLYHMEQGLNSLPGIELTHLRAGYFMENTFNSIGLIKQAGIMASIGSPDEIQTLIATRDIADAAAEELLAERSVDGRVRYLLGARDYTQSEVATILGKAIGKPELTYVQVDEATVRGGMEGAGLTADMAGLYLEMLGAISKGELNLPARDARNTTPTTLEDFAPVFAAAYNA